MIHVFMAFIAVYKRKIWLVIHTWLTVLLDWVNEDHPALLALYKNPILEF